MSSWEFTTANSWGALLFIGRRSVEELRVGTRCTVEGAATIEGDRLTLLNQYYRVELTDRAPRAGKEPL